MSRKRQSSESRLRESIRAENDARIANCMNRFNTQFPTEEECFEEIIRIAHEEGQVRCGYCNSTKLRRRRGSRIMHCLSCTRNSWITASTFFRRLRKARAWLAAIWLLEEGVPISCSKFQKLLGISNDTAHKIFKKLSFVIKSRMAGTECPSSVFLAVFAKRSRVTPAFEHPTKEEFEAAQSARKDQADTGESFDRTSNVALHMPTQKSMSESKREADNPQTKEEEESQNQVPGLSDHEQLVYSLIEETSVHVDVLEAKSGLSTGDFSLALVNLEIAGLIFRDFGASYKRAKKSKAPTPLNNHHFSQVPGAEQSILHIKTIYQAISRKYLQCYLALRDFLESSTNFGNQSLLRACFRQANITRNEILAYVSPITVMVNSG